MSPFTTRFAVCLLAICCCISTARADKPERITFNTADTGLEFSYGSSSTQPVIEFRHTIHMLADTQTEPLMQVFPDGRVRVHRPVYMKDAGDYEMRLTIEELNRLIRKLSNKGMMSFDDKRFADDKKIARNIKRNQTNRFRYISDTDTTEVDIRLDTYKRDKRSQMVTGLSKTVRLDNIEHDARYFTGLSEVQDMADSITELRSVMKSAIRPDRKIDAP